MTKVIGVLLAVIVLLPPCSAQTGRNARLLGLIQETIARIQAWHGPPSIARTDEAEHLSDLTAKIDPKKVDDKTLASMIDLMQSKDDSVRGWVAAALGEQGPRAKAAVPALLQDIRETDCIPLAELTSAAAARVALERIGVKPPPWNCGSKDPGLKPSSFLPFIPRAKARGFYQSSAAALESGKLQIPSATLGAGSSLRSEWQHLWGMGGFQTLRRPRKPRAR